MKSYEGKVYAVFYNDKLPKEYCHCICLSVLLINFVLKRGKNYYEQVFLKCKCIVKYKKIQYDGMEIYSDGSAAEISDKEQFGV